MYYVRKRIFQEYTLHIDAHSNSHKHIFLTEMHIDQNHTNVFISREQIFSGIRAANHTSTLREGSHSLKQLPSLVNLYWQRFALPYVPHTVPSTLTGLTARFGMDLGVSLLHLSPIIIFPDNTNNFIKHR